jgi:hypothetical protein
VKFDGPALLKAIDRSEPLRRELERRAPEAMKTMGVFRKRMGDKCNYVRASLQVIWCQEVIHGSGDIQPHLRAAGYPS